MTATHPVVVSSLDQARALAMAAAATGCPVTLVGDGAVGGAGWLRALADAVRAEHPGMAVVRTPFGTTRVVERELGEQLPRIC